MTAETPAEPVAATLDALDEDYNSEEDSDFDPEAAARAAAADEASSNSDSGSDGEDSAGAKKRKKKTAVKPKKKAKKQEDIDYEEGGEGGLIKTRAQREREALEEKQFKIEEVKQDASIDDIWASLQQSAEPWKQKPTSSTPTQTESPATEAPVESQPLSFAGELLPSTSDPSTPVSSTPTPTTTSRPLKPGTRRPKKRTSAFDTGPIPVKAKKLNTLEKSKMDWDGYVAKEGIKEELVQHEKGGKGYVERQGFLGRVEEREWEKRKGGGV